jgi:hypothetical protein
VNGEITQAARPRRSSRVFVGQSGYSCAASPCCDGRVFMPNVPDEHSPGHREYTRGGWRAITRTSEFSPRPRPPIGPRLPRRCLMRANDGGIKRNGHAVNSGPTRLLAPKPLLRTLRA